MATEWIRTRTTSSPICTDWEDSRWLRVWIPLSFLQFSILEMTISASSMERNPTCDLICISRTSIRFQWTQLLLAFSTVLPTKKKMTSLKIRGLGCLIISQRDCSNLKMTTSSKCTTESRLKQAGLLRVRCRKVKKTWVGLLLTPRFNLRLKLSKLCWMMESTGSRTRMIKYNSCWCSCSLHSDSNSNYPHPMSTQLQFTSKCLHKVSTSNTKEHNQNSLVLTQNLRLLLRILTKTTQFWS